jgi:hypothetical protein
MPLQLSRQAAPLPQRIVWNPDLVTDRDAAQARIAQLVAQGYHCQGVQAGEALLTPPGRAVDQLLIRVLDDNGDSRLLWDRRVPAECADARAKFDRYLQQGYRAYVTRSDGSKGARVETFDALMEEIIVAPGQPGDRPLGERGAREGILVPPTHPG